MKGVGKEALYIAFREGQNPVAAIEDKYRKHLIDRFGKLTLYSLSSDQPIAVDLEQMFVKLTATEKQERHAYVRENADGTSMTEAFSGSDSERHRDLLERGFQQLADPEDVWKYRVGRPKPEDFVQRTSELTLTLPEALRAHAHLAIIGAPGAGKTTALKWLALAYARRQVKERLELEEDRLPLFIALRDFNRFLDNLEKTSGLPSPLPPALLARHLQEYYAEHVSHLALPSDFFLRALATGQALVLLDGLDEVAVASKRTRAAEFVAACVRSYPGCRFVLSSRPRGYENDCRTHLAAHCSECRVRDFDDDDIAAFSRNWYLAVILAREGDNPTTRDKAASAAKNLQAAVKQERVRPLAANPLLLSILALIHQKGVGLPQRRVELYQECTEFLLGYWDQIRGGDTGRELANIGGLTRQEKCALLEPIALWIHERGEQGTEVSRKELEAKLAEQFSERFGDMGARAKQRATEFVDIIEQRAGLLVEREQDTFAFTHLTFQEYLAARALSDRENFVEETLKHLHDPWWREVHLLEVAHLSTPNTRRSREETGKLLAALHKAGSWLEADLHRDLLYAFHALCDVSPLGVETAFRQELTETVFKLWRTTKVKPLRNHIEERFSYAGATPVGSLLLQSLLPLTKDNIALTRSRAVAALGRLGAASATPDVLARLFALSQDVDDSVRSTAVGALGQLGAVAATPDVLARLVALSQDAHATMRLTVAEALGRLGAAAATPDVLARLVALSQDANENVRSSAAYALGKLHSAAATPDLFTRLVPLSQDAHADVRHNTAGALGQRGAAAATPDVLTRLVALSQDAHAGVRRNAALALGQLGAAAATPDVLAWLVALSQDANADVRQNVALALGQLGAAAATPDVLARLVALSQDANADVRHNTAEALGRLGVAATRPDVLAQLVALSQDANADVRRTATGALGQFGAAAAIPDVLARLVALSQDANDAVRRNAAWALGQMTEGLGQEQIESPTAWCRFNLTNDNHVFIIGTHQQVSEAAFDILHRLAARQARLAPAKLANRSKS